ncbi:hypothetical protein N8I77_006597 [Diaporthe amygdali]|uniref:2EXR domain-containing protein n=1 Tax=Phomopsis amygdali TaxID=1214568 RepID=A0AAD9W3Z1_PHOAM|nr:hypothetical protein N8I77_006597 [Diaporthe amygdali]
MSPEPATEFPRFLELPYEIRWKIYMFCLPTHVIDGQLREPFPQDESSDEYNLAFRYIVAKFSRTPVIARASAEVYRVVRRHLVAPPANEWAWNWQSLDEVGYTDPTPIYFNPKFDIICVLIEHLIPPKKTQQRREVTPHCLAKNQDVILALDRFTIPCLLLWKEIADYCFLGRKNCIVIMSETVFIKPMEWIVSCGLFGLFGEERTVLVDVDDLGRIDYFDKKLNSLRALTHSLPEHFAEDGIRRYSSHSDVDPGSLWDKDSPVTSAEERAQIIAKDKERAISLIRQYWLEVNGYFNDTKPDDPCFVPSEGEVYNRVFDEEHPNAKRWLDKLPAFSFAVRVHAKDAEECERLLHAQAAREASESE